MTIIEVGREQTSGLSLRQRWSHYFVIGYAIVMIVIGLNLRDSILYATLPYENVQAGIRVFYPQNWLLDTDGDYVVRVRDMGQPEFKTTIQVQIIPISSESTVRNLLDNLAFTRFQVYAAYRQFPRTQITLADGTEATSIDYTFVFNDSDQFLESLPSVIVGQDVIVLQRGQAVVISYQANADRYEEFYPIFQNFLVDMEL